MRSSKTKKEETHERIVRLAAQRFRAGGIGRLGVAELMREVGLTHGGFYGHFASRDELVAVAIERALQDGTRAATAAIARRESDRKTILLDMVDYYLGRSSNSEAECPMTALVGDVPRSNMRARSAYTQEIGACIELLASLMPGSTPGIRRRRAIAVWSTILGAISFARTVNEEKFAIEIFESTADVLKAQLD